MLFRHPPGVNQRVAALFIAARHHDMLLGRIRRAMVARRAEAKAALAAHAPGWKVSGGQGGAGLWIEVPKGVDATALAAEALTAEVVIEPGDVFFGGADKPKNVFRLGLSVIPQAKIGEGIERLAKAARALGA